MPSLKVCVVLLFSIVNHAKRYENFCSYKKKNPEQDGVICYAHIRRISHFKELPRGFARVKIKDGVKHDFFLWQRICTPLRGGNIYIQTVIYTAAVQEPNRIYTRLPRVSLKLLLTRQPFQSQIGYIHGCQVSA